MALAIWQATTPTAPAAPETAPSCPRQPHRSASGTYALRPACRYCEVGPQWSPLRNAPVEPPAPAQPQAAGLNARQRRDSRHPSEDWTKSPGFQGPAIGDSTTPPIRGSDGLARIGKAALVAFCSIHVETALVRVDRHPRCCRTRSWPSPIGGTRASSELEGVFRRHADRTVRRWSLAADDIAQVTRPSALW